MTAANSETTVKKVRGKPFQKGQSGNPSGRPKDDPGLKEACRSHTMECIEVLVSIVNNKKSRDNDRIKAAEVLLDRGYGKAVQAVDIDAKNIPQVVFVGGDNVPD